MNNIFRYTIIIFETPFPFSELTRELRAAMRRGCDMAMPKIRAKTLAFGAIILTVIGAVLVGLAVPPEYAEEVAIAHGVVASIAWGAVVFALAGTGAWPFAVGGAWFFGFAVTAAFIASPPAVVYGIGAVALANKAIDLHYTRKGT